MSKSSQLHRHMVCENFDIEAFRPMHKMYGIMVERVCVPG